MNRTPVLAPVRPRAPTWPGPKRRAADDLLWIAVVAAAYTVVQLVLAVPGTGLGWDESVYVSQVARGSEAAFFSAPRARGITFLVAPVTAVTSSVEVLRVFLAVLSGAGLFAALAVWRTLLPARVLALAGGLFAGLWITVFYGPQVMPNLWVALGALFTVGCFLRAVRDPADRAGLLGTGAGLAFVALMRPGDAVWLLLPLAVVALLSRTARRPALLVALVAGTLVGCLPWVVEAYVAYDGLLARLRRAGEIQGHLGPHFAVDDQLRALEGRSLCRPCDMPWRKPVTGVWFLVLWPLAAGGVMVAVLRRCPFTTAPSAVRPSAVLVPALAGLVLAVPYLLLIGYAAPRFLLPAYALLALPVAVCLGRLAGSARPRAAAAVVLGLALAGHLTVQYAVLNGTVERGRDNNKAFERITAELRRNGVRAPCVISGSEAPRIALRTGCASRQTGGHDGSITRAALARLGDRRAVAYVVDGRDRPPSFTRGWRPLTLPGLPSRPELRAYLSPAAAPPTAGR